MNTSTELDKLYAALVKAIPHIEPAKKEQSGQVGPRAYKYADLAEVLRVIREPLQKHGLAVLQTVDETSESLYVVTRIIHESGQWIESRVPLAGYETAQQLGSALTYSRRYGLTAALSIATEDDDGASAAPVRKKPEERPTQPKLTLREKMRAALAAGETRETVETKWKTALDNAHISQDDYQDGCVEIEKWFDDKEKAQ